MEQSCPRAAEPQPQPLPSAEPGPSKPRSPSSESNGPNRRLIGDLEVPFDILKLLLSNEAIQEDCELILDTHPDPLSALFAYELGVDKPPPPPEPKAMPKPKRDRKAERERRKAAQMEAQKALDSGPGFRAPTPTSLRLGSGALTRSARAAAEAYEAEVIGTGEGEGDAASSGPSASSDANGKPSSKRWKRPIVQPGQAEVPPVVDNVDSHQSFTMFDEGWILPAGQRRGGRAPIERVERPPPRKKQRIGGAFFSSSRYLFGYLQPCL